MTDNVITLPNVSASRTAQLATNAGKSRIRRYTVDLDLPPEKWALLERIARESRMNVAQAMASMVEAWLDAAAAEIAREGEQ